jgi:SP family myo-inositol transporter-like MFS transporter 13
MFTPTVQSHDKNIIKTTTGFVLWLLGINAAIGGFLFGYDTGSASASLLEMKLPRERGGLAIAPLTNWQQETVVSMVVLGAFVGAALAGHINQRLGRRKVLLLGALLFTVGALGMASAWDLWPMLAARIVVGLGVGLCSHTVPLYVSECAPAHLRGRLCFLNDMCVVLGQVSAAAVSAGFFYGEVRECWRWIMGLAAIPSIMMFAGIFVMPESPRWLAMNGNIDDCRPVLETLRQGSSTEQVELELQEIADAVAKEQNSRGPGLLKYFRDPSIRRPLLLGCSLQLIQQWVGINTIVYYGGSILQKSNANMCHPSISDGGFHDPFSSDNKRNVALSILINSAQLVGVFASWYLVDRIGRRPLLISSLVGIIVTLFAMGGIYTLTEVPKVAIVVIMMLYLIFFGVGMSPVPWTVNAEIYPMDVRAKCMSFSTGTNWLMNYIVAQTFLSLSLKMSTDADCPNGHPNGVFWLFGTIGLVGLIGFALKLPETKGKTLEEITDLFAHPSTNATKKHRNSCETSEVSV